MRELYKDPRKILAYFWSLIAAAMLFYILVRFGGKTEILTLIIGIIGGSIIGGIFGVYFNATASHPKGPEGTTTADITATITTENKDNEK